MRGSLRFSIGVAATVLLVSTEAAAQEWRVAHWNMLHGWGRYWDVQVNQTDPNQLWPPAGPFTAISDDGSGPDGNTYGIATGEPPASSGCGTTTYPATWDHSSQPLQNFLGGTNVALDQSLVALSLSEARYCLNGSGVKNALAAGNPDWSNAAVLYYAIGNARGDTIIAKHGWAAGFTPNTAAPWHPINNPGSDVAQMTCTGQTKYNVLHAKINTAASPGPDDTVHLFALRICGDSNEPGCHNTCEIQDLDAFVQSKTAGSDRVIVIGDYNFNSSSTLYTQMRNRGYVDAGSSPLLTTSDKSAATCCFGSGDGASDGSSHSTRIDLAFTKNLGDAVSYWLGNKSVPAGQEVAMSDHAIIKVGFDPSSPPTEPPSGSGFQDEFDDDVLDTNRWTANSLFSGATNTAVAVNERNQRLEIGPLLQNASGSAYNGIRTSGTYDLTNAFASVRLVQAPSSATSAYAMFTVGPNGSNHYRFWVSGGALHCERKIQGVKDENLCNVPYSSAAHQYLRIRHDGTNVVFETSPTGGSDWTLQYSEPWNAAVTATSLIFELKAGTSGVQSSAPGIVAFDSFEYAANALIQDEFDDNVLDTNLWTANSLFSGATNTAVAVNERNQRLEIGPLLQNASGSAYNGIRTSGTYDLTNAFASVRLIQAPSSATSAYAMFTVGPNGSNHYRFWVSGGALHCERKIQGVKDENLCNVAYSSAAHQYLRIRHDGTNVVFETSPTGGSDWTLQHSEPWNAAVTATSLISELKAGTSGVQSSAPGTVAFDSFRLSQ